MINPANGADFEPWISEFRWSRSMGAESYHLQIADNENFTSLVFNDSTIADTTYLFAGLMDNSAYFWRIRAKNVSGTSAWTPAWQFQTLVNGTMSAGTYVVQWSAVNQASGIYYYRFSAGEFVRIKRMILIK